MSASTATGARTKVIYPETDGQPIAEKTVQFEWIVAIKEGSEALFLDRRDVFVAGDLFWYPVEGDPKTRAAPEEQRRAERLKAQLRSLGIEPEA
jgi:hypothetical protein